MPQQFTTTRRVQFNETDMAGIVHFVNFYVYMEQTEHEFFRALGLKVMNRQPDGSVISWPRVAASCSFDAPAYYDDLLEGRLEVGRGSVKSLTFKIEFWRDATRIAHGTLKTVCCRFRPGEKMKSIEIPPEYAAKFNEFAAT